MARVKYYDQASQEWKYADAALNMKGKDGYTPQKGVDYFTEEDVRELTEKVLDQGVLSYNEQELTEDQKAQARENIGIDQISFDKLTEDLDADGFRITNLPLPQSGSEPATKEFVENFTIEGSTYVATDDGEGNVIIRPYLADEDELVFKSHIQNQNNPHGVTAAQVGARPDTWTPTASEVGAVPAAALDAIEEYLVQEANTYTDAQVKNAAPRNLLINSDFRNPVNSNGKSSYTGNAYSIDKWRAYHANTTHTVIPGEGITVSATDANSNLYQQLDTTHIDVTRVMTAAACDSDGNIYIWTGIASTSSHKNGACVYISNGNYLFRLTISKTVTWKWAALYYGEYTLDTLPEYQPKGYETELLICRQYDSTSGEYIGLQKFGRPHNLLDNSYWENVNSIVNQKGQSSYSGNVYTIDRWYGRVAAQTLTVRGADITVTSTTGGSYAGILQKIENISAYAGKTITLACKVYSTKPVAVGFADASDTSALKETVDNVSNTRIIICSYTVPSGATTDTVIPRLLLRSTAANDYMRLYWAALYEGEYTLDTLPEYQPKGYGAELAECQRHYITLTGSLGYQALGCAVAISTTQVVIPLFLPVSLRTPNISLDVSDITKFHLQGENNIDIADMYVSRVNNTIIKLVCTASSALAAGKSYVLSNGANADAVLAISANFL